jgi:invasion protein IalB
MIARTLATAAALLLGATSLAAAQTPTPLETFNAWAAFAYTGANGKVCYAITQPTTMEPSGVNRDPVYVFITNRPGEGVRREVSIVTGYPYREGSRTTAVIGTETFVMYTSGDGAWVENAAEESRLIDTMRAGSSLVVTGTSQRGTVTTDTYSLSGVTAAINRIDQECQ